MKKKVQLLCILLIFSIRCIAQKHTTTIYQAGESGYACFRIPAIVQSPDGLILAFAEGRRSNCADFGNVDIVLKTSKNKGKTWSRLQKVVENDSFQASNSAPVFDLLDPRYPQGRLFLFFNTGNAHENEVRHGKGKREAWYITSTDCGKSWAAPINITSQVHRPLPDTGDWRCFANTPGHALQLPTGQLVIPANRSAGPPQQTFLDYRAFAYYTDNHGESFHIMPEVDYPGSNEATAAALPNGHFLMSIRDQSGRANARILAIGNINKQWDTAWVATALPDPVCQGSLLNFSTKNKHVLLHSNPASTSNRCCLQVKISLDNGQNWVQIYELPNKKAAYSDLVQIDANTAGLLAEVDDYSRIVFKRFRVRVKTSYLKG